MPGIMGFSGVPPESGSELFLQKMIAAHEPEGSYRIWSYNQETLGLARISLGVVNAEPQPVWDSHHQVCVILEGELYDTGHLRDQIEKRGHNFTTPGDAELILKLYLEAGDLFASQLNGAYIAAIYDRRYDRLILVNDRLGLYPLYYANVAGRFLFASKVSALFADSDLPRHVDKLAIAQFLTFDHVLDDRTFLESVKLMPQGALISISGDRIQITPYSSLHYPKEYPLRCEEEYIEELSTLLKQAIHRQAIGDYPKAVLLSGGMDSRMIAVLLDQESGDWPYHSFTWGIHGCDDARYAREVASKLRSTHHFFPLKPDYLPVIAEKGVHITDGLGNVVNMHALATLKEQVSIARVIYKGFLGDAMFGFALRHQHWAEYNVNTAVQAHLQVHEDQGVITFHPRDHAAVFTTEFQHQIGSGVMDSYRDGMLASGSRMLADQRLFFDLTQRVPRMTLRGVDVVRSLAHVRLPFADNDLLDFAIHLPPGLRHNRQLMQSVFLRAFPEMARIPISWTGFPLQENFRELGMRARHLLDWHLKNIGLVKQTRVKWRPYHDYPNWFRGVLRPWVESILLSERCLGRGYLQPNFIRQLVEKHWAGEDQTVQIGALLSVEQWHRLFID